jgi:hypothetical protein
MKRPKPADFGDILAALDQLDQQAAESAFGGEDKAKGDDDRSAAGTASGPTPRLRSILGHFSWPWRTGAGAASRATSTPYEEQAAEAVEAATARQPGPASEPTDAQAEAPQIQASQTEDEAIAEELGLQAELAPADLQRIRRDFAKKNHPDRFAPAQRLGAARRMSIANMLIDAYLKQRPSGH